MFDTAIDTAKAARPVGRLLSLWGLAEIQPVSNRFQAVSVVYPRPESNERIAP
jgi:hypothetical protein